MSGVNVMRMKDVIISVTGVQQGVNERLAQSGVSLKTGGSPDYANMSDADYYAATYKPGGNK
mgnify:CR=1 FL=1